MGTCSVEGTVCFIFAFLLKGGLTLEGKDFVSLGADKSLLFEEQLLSLKVKPHFGRKAYYTQGIKQVATRVISLCNVNKA